MKHLALLLLLAGLLPVASAPPTPDQVRQTVDDYFALRPTDALGREFTLPEALAAQRAFVRALEPRLGKPVGFKVGLVTRETQERFGMNGPVRGVLLEKMLLRDGAEVPARFGVRPLLEADLIVVVKDKAINKATGLLDVARQLKEVVAFIELPDNLLPTNPPPSGEMLAAYNIGARLGVLGQRVPVRANLAFINALAAMTVTVSDDTGAELGRARGDVILDHPLHAVLWLIEDLQQTGQSLQAGDLISLGSLKALPAPVGKSVTVRYLGLPGGPLEVTVKLKAGE